MKSVSFDLETFLITRERPAPWPVCISWQEEGAGPEVSTAVYGMAWSLLRPAASDLLLVGHNVAYDMAVLLAAHPDFAPLIFDAYKKGRVTDTGIRQQLWDIATGRARDDDAVRRYSLATLVEMIFDRDISKWKGGDDAWRLRYSELYGVPLEQWPAAAIEYPKIDAEETLNVFIAQRDKVGDLIRDDAFQTYAAFGAHLMACAGLRTDPAAVAEVEKSCLAEMEKLKPELIQAGLLQYQGPKKDPQRSLVKKDAPARERMLRACREKNIEPLLTKTGRELARKSPEAVAGNPKYVAIDKAACMWADDELLMTRAKYVLAEKILKTYVPPLKEGARLPITTGYGLASTTRTTSSAPREPAVGTNLQNAPRKGGVRECFIPRDGHLFLSGDFSGAELHALAQVCKRTVGHSVLGDLLNDGMDAHCYVGADLIHTTYEDCRLRVEQGDPVAEKARQDGKASNFGFGGLMGPWGFVVAQLRNGYRYSLEEASRLRENWLRKLPEMPMYFDWVRQMLGPNNDVTIELWPGGPLRRVRKATVLANSGFQALAARGGKQAYLDVLEAYYAKPSSSLYHNTRAVLYVHDEVFCETPETDADTLDKRAREFAKIMEDAFNPWVPDYPTTVDPVLTRRLYKGAKTVLDEKGRVTVWAP